MTVSHPRRLEQRRSVFSFMLCVPGKALPQLKYSGQEKSVKIGELEVEIVNSMLLNEISNHLFLEGFSVHLYFSKCTSCSFFF